MIGSGVHQSAPTDVARRVDQRPLNVYEPSERQKPISELNSIERNKSSEAGETATEIIQLSVKICPMFRRINSPNRLWPMCGFRAEY